MIDPTRLTWAEFKEQVESSGLVTDDTEIGWIKVEIWPPPVGPWVGNAIGVGKVASASTRDGRIVDVVNITNNPMFA